jgi:hypothetical protein
MSRRLKSSPKDKGSGSGLAGKEIENLPSGARSRRRQSYQNVSRETFLSGRGRKPYKSKDSGPTFNVVGSTDLSVRFPGGR